MFGLFKSKKHKYSEVPEWANFFNLEEFNDFIALIEQHFKNQKVGIDVVLGILKVPDFGKDNQFGLLNLASICHTAKKSEWKLAVNDHFNSMIKADEDGKKLKERIENFSEVSKYLALRIWPKEYLEGGVKPVYRENIEDLITVLVLDLPTAVQSLKIEDVKKWNKSLDELFDIGKENVLTKYPVQIDNQIVNDKPCYILHGEHFFVSIQALILEKYKQCIGKYGTIVSFPHRHVIITYPINGEDVIKSVNDLMAITNGMYKEGPGPISPNIYWYIAGNFTKLPYEVKDNSINFCPPKSFIDLLEKIVND